MKRNVQLTICRDTLSPGIHGAIMTTGAGKDYIIVTNQQETETQQAAAFLHECLHLFHDDLNRGGQRGRNRGGKARRNNRAIRDFKAKSERIKDRGRKHGNKQIPDRKAIISH